MPTTDVRTKCADIVRLVFDFAQSALGEAQDVHGHLQLQRPEVKLRDPATNTIVSTITSDVPDLVVAVGSLTASPVAHQDATLLVRFRRGQPFPGEAPLVCLSTARRARFV